MDTDEVVVSQCMKSANPAGVWEKGAGKMKAIRAVTNAQINHSRMHKAQNNTDRTKLKLDKQVGGGDLSEL